MGRFVESIDENSGKNRGRVPRLGGRNWLFGTIVITLLMIVTVVSGVAMPVKAATQTNDQELLTRVIYGEARGEIEQYGEEALVAVGWVVKNRVNDPRFYLNKGGTYSGVCTTQQFNGFSLEVDPSKLTGLDKEAWLVSSKIAGQVITGEVPDPTSGATSFYSTKPPPDGFGDKPMIEISSPKVGETWGIGTTQTINWSWKNWPGSWNATAQKWSGFGDPTAYEFKKLIGNHRFYYESTTAKDIRIDLSIDGGKAWTTILPLPKTPNDGKESWIVTGTPTTQAVIRVVSLAKLDDSTIQGTSGLFTIKDVTPPSVMIVSPNGGEVWKSREVSEIKWAASDNVDVTKVDIFYSINGGEKWTPIASGLSNTNSYFWKIPFFWKIPYTRFTNCLVRIDAYDASGNNRSDTSDKPFTIR